MFRYFRLYKHIFQFTLVKNLAYPQNFLLWSLMDIVWAIVNLGFFRILLLNIPHISGWTWEELTIPLGLFYLLNAFIWGAMHTNMKQIPLDVNKGNLDLYLTRPVNSQFLLSTRNINFSLIPSIVVGAFLTWYGYSLNHLLNVQNLLLALLFLTTSATICYSLWFMSVTISIWFNRLLNIPEVFTTVFDVAKYPVDIYPPLARFLLLTVFPLGLVLFLPSEIILGRISISYLFFPILAAGILLFISHKFWNFALRHYSSASS